MPINLNFDLDPYLKEIDLETRRINSKFRETKISPPALFEDFLIQFIGGPFNAQQKYFKRGQNSQIHPNAIWRMAILEPLHSFHDAEYFQTADYLLTFIPQNQTPFSDAQIIIGIFQEQTS